MPIRTLQRRFPRLGRISAGYQDSKLKDGGKPGEIVTFPRRSQTLVFGSDDLARVEVLQAQYGGEIKTSPLSTPEDEKYYLVSEATRMRVVLPAGASDQRTCTQWMEAYSATGLVRRCDGIECGLHRLPATKKKVRGREIEVPGDMSHEPIACVCESDDLGEKDRCKPVVRLAVLPADDDVWQRIRGIGVWIVHSGGWASNTELASDIELIENLVGDTGAGLPLALELVQVASRHGDIPMFRLNVQTTPAEAAALRGVTRVSALAAVQASELAAPEDEYPVGTFVDTETGEILEADPDDDPFGVNDVSPDGSVAATTSPGNGGSPAQDAASETPPQPAQATSAVPSEPSPDAAYQVWRKARDELDRVLDAHSVDPEAIRVNVNRKYGTSCWDDLPLAALQATIRLIERTPRKSGAA